MILKWWLWGIDDHDCHDHDYQWWWWFQPDYANYKPYFFISFVGNPAEALRRTCHPK